MNFLTGAVMNPIENATMLVTHTLDIFVAPHKSLYILRQLFSPYAVTHCCHPCIIYVNSCVIERGGIYLLGMKVCECIIQSTPWLHTRC